MHSDLNKCDLLYISLFFHNSSLLLNNSYLCLCVVHQSAMESDPGPRESVFQFEDMNLLPLRDIGVFGNSGHEFGFTIGPVCFS